MKKIFIPLLCLLAQGQFAQAAILKIGPRLAIHSSRVQIKSTQEGILEFKSKLGYQAGLLAQINLPIIYLQPELLITVSGTSYKQNGQGINLRYTKLELPIMVGIKIGGLARIQAGPNLGLLLTAKETINNIKDIQVNYNPLSLAYQAGIGLDLSQLIIDLKYEGGLTNLGAKAQNRLNNYQPSLWILGIGLSIF